MTSQWNPRLDHAKRDCRRRRRSENENVDEKYVVVRKIEKVVIVSGSRGCRKQLQDLQLGAWHCDVGLTLRYRRRRG